MHHAIQVTTTTDSKQRADEIARHLVEHQLAACVQIDGPIESVYRWKGAVETAVEWRCTAKCLASQFADVENAIRKVHHYELPEIVAVDLVGGSQSYLQWIEDQTSSD